MLIMIVSLEVTHRHPALAVNIKDTETLGELWKKNLLAAISSHTKLLSLIVLNVCGERGVSRHTSSFGDLFCLSHRLKIKDEKYHKKNTGNTFEYIGYDIYKTYLNI